MAPSVTAMGSPIGEAVLIPGANGTFANRSPFAFEKASRNRLHRIEADPEPTRSEGLRYVGDPDTGGIVDIGRGVEFDANRGAPCPSG
jgi:hypothetical protein